MLFNSFDAVTKQKSIPHVTFFFGKEHFLRDEAIDQLTKRIKAELSDSFDYDVVDAENCSQEEVVSMSLAFPFVAEKRFVVVKNIEKYTTQKSKKKNDSNESPLVKYLHNPSPTTYLLLIGDSSEVDGLYNQLNNSRTTEKAEKRIASLKEPFHTLIKDHVSIEFSALYEREIPHWLSQRLKNEGKEITQEGLDILITKSTTSLRDLHNEIQKLITYSPNKKKFTVEDVLNVVGQSKSYNIFELQKAIGEKKTGKALDITLRMVSSEKNEILIITMLTRYFSSLFKLLEVSSTTSNPVEMSKATDINSYFIPEYLSALRYYSPKDLANAFIALRDADVMLKSSNTETEAIMQKMILTIVGKS